MECKSHFNTSLPKQGTQNLHQHCDLNLSRQSRSYAQGPNKKKAKAHQ